MDINTPLWHLTALPVEILNLILDNLDKNEVLALSSTQSRLRSVALPRLHSRIVMIEDDRSSYPQQPPFAQVVSPYLYGPQRAILDFHSKQQGQGLPSFDNFRKCMRELPDSLSPVAAFVNELSIATEPRPRSLEMESFLFVEHLVLNLRNLRILNIPVPSVGASRLFQVLPSGPMLNALCIHITLLPSSEDEALSTISNLEHLKLCHTLGVEDSDTTASLIKLLVQNMGTLKSLEFRAENTYIYLDHTQECIQLEAELIRFPRLESLSLFSLSDFLGSRADMAIILSAVCEGIDYSQLTSMSVCIDERDLTILNAYIAAYTSSRSGLQLQDLSIDLRSEAHLNFLSSFDSLVAAHLDNKSQRSLLTDIVVAGICRHKGLQHLKLCRDALGHFMDPVGPALRTIFQSLPMLHSFTFTSADQWFENRDMHLVAGALPASNLRSICVECSTGYPFTKETAYHYADGLLQPYLAYKGTPSWAAKLRQLKQLTIGGVSLAISLNNRRNDPSYMRVMDIKRYPFARKYRRRVWFKQMSAMSPRDAPEAAARAWSERIGKGSSPN